MPTVEIHPANWWLCPVCGETNFAKGIPEHIDAVNCPHCDASFQAARERGEPPTEEQRRKAVQDWKESQRDPL